MQDFGKLWRCHGGSDKANTHGDRQPNPGVEDHLVYEQSVLGIAHVEDVPDLGERQGQERHGQRGSRIGIEQILGAPVDMISVGPERDQAIVTRDVFGAAIAP